MKSISKKKRESTLASVTRRPEKHAARHTLEKTRDMKILVQDKVITLGKIDALVPREALPCRTELFGELVE